MEWLGQRNASLLISDSNFEVIFCEERFYVIPLCESDEEPYEVWPVAYLEFSVDLMFDHELDMLFSYGKDVEIDVTGEQDELKANGKRATYWWFSRNEKDNIFTNRLYNKKQL